MTFAHILLYFTLLSQTKVLIGPQGFGTNIKPSEYYFTVTTLSNGSVQLVPGTYFAKSLQIMESTVPVSGAICGRAMDGESHPTYEFGRVGNVIFDENSLYICTPGKKWKRILMENF